MLSAITTGLSIAFSFVLLEFGLAKYYAATEEHVSEMVFDAVLGWKPAIGSRWVKPAHTLREHTIDINQFGLRNGDIAPEKRNDERRVIVLGDSFTFAKAVQSTDIFPSLLEKHLNQNGRFEVINAGVPGYGTAQEMLMMKGLAEKEIVGDVYVLMVFVNDILDNLRLDYGDLGETAARPGFALQQDGELKQVAYPKKEYSESLVPSEEGKVGFVTTEVARMQMASFLQSKPALMSLLSELGLEVKLPRMPGLINGWYHQNLLDSGIPLTRALIKGIQIEARKHQGRLLVSMIPSPIQVYPEVYDSILANTFPNNKSVEDYFGDRTRAQRVIGAICRELEIPFLDLLPILLSSNNKDLFIPLEGHFTAEGHAVAAQHLAMFIENNDSAHLPKP